MLHYGDTIGLRGGTILVLRQDLTSLIFYESYTRYRREDISNTQKRVFYFAFELLVVIVNFNLRRVMLETVADTISII